MKKILFVMLIISSMLMSESKVDTKGVNVTTYGSRLVILKFMYRNYDDYTRFAQNFIDELPLVIPAASDFTSTKTEIMVEYKLTLEYLDTYSIKGLNNLLEGITDKNTPICGLISNQISLRKENKDK